MINVCTFIHCFTLRLSLAFGHFHGKTARGSLGYVYVFESVDHLTDDST